MAKRKRLSPTTLIGQEPLPAGRGEASSPDRASDRVSDGASDRAAAPSSSTLSAVPPIARVAGTSAAEAALRELSDEVASARAEGRLVQRLPLAAIDAAHLNRDRMVTDGEELSALKQSIAERGQQVPIDVVDLGAGRYGLISGWRRLRALQDLFEETDGAQFSEVLAVLRRPAGAAQAYLSMIEENELRVGLSYYERAQVAARASEADVFDGSHAAIAVLFPTASKAKRSKIASFVRVYYGLGDMLRFPWEIGERLGLRLAQALADGQGARLRAALEMADPQSAEAELAALSGALDRSAKTPDATAKTARSELPGGIALTRSRGALKLSGPGVDDALEAALIDWLRARD